MPAFRPSSEPALYASAKPARKRAGTEAALHRSVCEYLCLALTDHSWWTTFPMGGGGKARGGRLKAMGAKSGVPDILVVFAGRAHWIEMKAPKGRLSDAQEATLEALERVGCPTTVARSIADVEFALRRWMIPLRASLGRAA